jgi:hypothetical protein
VNGHGVLRCLLKPVDQYMLPFGKLS